MSYVINTPAQLKPILVGFRKSKGMSQKDMAEKLNVSQQAYQALESNPQSVTLERLMKVLNILSVKLHLSDTELHLSLEKAVIRKLESGPDFMVKKLDDSFVVNEVKTKNAPSRKITKKLSKDSW
jgi:HTH-type transcriptional regulator/antitoxin HipB